MNNRPARSFIAPQLCTLRDRPPNGDAWVHEIKFDGYRLQLQRANGTAKLLTRNGHDWTSRFPALLKGLDKLPDCILDGELTAVDEKGAPSFSALQSAIASKRTANLVYFAFDLLAENGKDLRPRPLLERKTQLQRLLRRLPKISRIRYVDHLTGDAATILRHVCGLGLEGVVSKRADGRYVSGRGKSWIKVKCFQERKVLIGGWIERRGVLATFLIGEPDGKDLRYLGRLGAALPARTARDLLQQLRAIEIAASPFVEGPAGKTRAGAVRWAEPRYQATIRYLTETKSGGLRHHTIKEIVRVAGPKPKP